MNKTLQVIDCLYSSSLFTGKPSRNIKQSMKHFPHENTIKHLSTVLEFVSKYNNN